MIFVSLQNNIIGAFLKLEQLLTTNDAYTQDDFTIAAIPSADHVSLLINASALSESTAANSSNNNAKLKKVSVSSVGSDRIVEEPPQQGEVAPKEDEKEEAKEAPVAE